MASGAKAENARAPGWLPSFAEHRSGIGLRLLFFILLFSSAVTLGSTVLQLYVDYRRDVSNIERRLDEIERSYAGSLASSLWNLDVPQLKVQLEGLLKLPDMQALELQELNSESANPLTVKVGRHEDSKTVARDIPIVLTGADRLQVIGTLHAEATLAGVYERLGDTALLILLSQGVKTFLVSLFILYLFHRLVTRHLEAISDYLKRYNLQQPSPPLALRRAQSARRDEFDDVVSSFNHMSMGLQLAYDELREVNAELERDIEVRRNYEARLLRQAHYDDLTGLPNRLLLLDRLNRAISEATRENAVAALLCIDLDHFKNVNDTLGYRAGDALLVMATERLRACLRECDTLARIGGDEFIILLPGIEDDCGVQTIAARVVDAFAQPYVIDGHEHFVTASVGVTMFPTDGAEGQSLLSNADLAMYKAKELGRNRYHFFTQEINRRMQERLVIERRLRGAAARRELLLHYQPIVDLRTNAPGAFEALVRWRQADGTIYYPGQFISVAEDMGLIAGIGDWVAATACSEMRRHLCECPPLRRVAVNVSPPQLRTDRFGKYIERLLTDSGLPPECLELEITEGMLMDDTPETGINLKLLCDLGVRLSIDDFGTGYSSLSYLQRYPFDTLKIDRSFIIGVDKPNTARLVETIITMAHGLGMEVIAEGVETAEQLAFLRQHDCDFAQGYYFSRPIPICDLEKKLTAWEHGKA